MGKREDAVKAVQDYGRFLKRKLKMARVLGICSCVMCILCMVGYYFKFSLLANEMMTCLVLTYFIANIFSANSNLQFVKSGNAWQRVNGILSIIIYLCSIALSIIAFVTGEFVFNF